MASKLGLMRKREAVDDRLRSATNRLQSRGVDVGSFPDEGRDRDVKAYERVEHTARLLEACIERIDEMKAEFKQMGEQHGQASDAAKAEVARLIQENKGLSAAMKDAKKKESRKKDDVDKANQEGYGAPGPDADTGAAAPSVTTDGKGAGLQPGTGTVEVTPDGGQVVAEPREGSGQQPGDVVESPE